MRPVSGIRVFGIRFGILMLSAYWCLIFTGTHLPKIPRGIPRINDKVMHFTAFFVLATLMSYCTNSPQLWKRFGVIAAVCLIYAMIDELTQSLVRGRTTDIYDFIADAAGTLSAIALYLIIRRAVKPKRSRNALLTD